VTATALGRDDLTDRLTTDREAHLDLERHLLESPLLADTGKQLMVTGYRRAAVR
jgi:hypothetical protein